MVFALLSVRGAGKVIVMKQAIDILIGENDPELLGWVDQYLKVGWLTTPIPSNGWIRGDLLGVNGISGTTAYGWYWFDEGYSNSPTFQWLSKKNERD